MRNYNDYEQLVYKYLKNYNSFKHQIESVNIEIDGIREQIEILGGLKATVYDKVIVSGGEKHSSVEQAIERKEKLEGRLLILTANRQRLTTLIQRIDAALATLEESERKIVELKHIVGENWIHIAMQVPYSERSCQRRCREAVERVAAIMFPDKAIDRKADFVFVDSKIA